MGEAYIMRRGGAAKAKAVIAVTYPSGSTCTCTNGTKTIPAKDTSGGFLFLLPAAGEWTVSCTDGTKTASRSVTAAEKQSLSVTLAYELVLFENGNIYEGLGGIQFRPGDSGSEISGGKILLKGNVYAAGYCSSNSPIDFSDFNTLKMTYELSESSNSKFGLSNSSNFDESFVYSKAVPVTTSSITVDLDISSATNLYLQIFSGNGYATITRIWLE